MDFENEHMPKAEKVGMDKSPVTPEEMEEAVNALEFDDIDGAIEKVLSENPELKVQAVYNHDSLIESIRNQIMQDHGLSLSELDDSEYRKKFGKIIDLLDRVYDELSVGKRLDHYLRDHLEITPEAFEE